MFMRYLGGGIGLHSHTAMDGEWENIEDEPEIPDAVNEDMDEAQDIPDHQEDDIENPNEEDYNEDRNSAGHTGGRA